MPVFGGPSGHAVPTAFTDPAQPFDVAVDQILWFWPLVAHNLLALRALQPVQTQPPQDHVHGRAGQGELPAQVVGSAAEAQTRFHYALHHITAHAWTRMQRTRARIPESVRAVAAEPVDPFARGLTRDTGSASCTGDAPAVRDTVDDQSALIDGQAGVRMLHEDPSLRLWLGQPTTDREGSLSVNNLYGPFS